ncbi:dbbfaaa8-8ed8-4ffa-ad6e-37067b1c61ae-CDS [Sclerotinia trifoliorum]|uniref:Dbbfaaa8-8ed8-4ffa-ad6e-37067b1c61ae-CDS n=1 Tax=Sclerotinia trifoliorum TaxID=28548 RepID=A0A8H2ZX78_9HELO|nr:dbbfaaa8-8ed8-4ffa-ad6e-37067b1c61ae-CDS [Sclerotinia trifoliorum]
MPYTAPPTSKISIFSPNDFTDIDLHSDEVPKEQVSTKQNPQFDKASKKTARRCYLIPIGILIVIIAILAGFIAFLLNNPGVIGKPCPVPANFNEPATLVHTRTIIRTGSLNTTKTTTQTANKTPLTSQATGMASGIDPVAVATCLGVLENACAMKNSSTTFGECDPLFEFFYCDLTDMRVFRGAMEPDADGSSPVCQPMKRFCSKATTLNKKSV